MNLYTFTYNTQWMDGIYQVIAESEDQAREMMKNDSAWITTHNRRVLNFYPLLGEYEAKIIHTYEIDNPNYEG